ncbi:aromatic-ring-hydroxylating dioxygenase subunit beta [Pseudomonas stutzeri]|uniref:aromatic-ring-hydroxylating dioxygenase subunit beta n=1 Tax=Pseudomonadaceae TaxID=135621 RepID=UPI001AB013EA|nr:MULTISPECIES: aromatic-ring-hydroxylating dioxygenase subunit beta [Pseudomonadaceae]MCC8345292.1 aromatic-ring-hydroxylating dioxygenase subunit beta [Stutzerimonas stutzeri]QTF59204.1 aromatic-ring-hydroxylating dioxygenase subunit beta [Stutzerimonas frequens]UHH33401.1 aromatic-ring-hydroxylating dioxygenase subunit beta [Pseudomonas veronii]
MTQNIFTLISQSQALYARCIDEGQLEAWPEFFLENCLYTVTTADNYRQGLPAGMIWANNRGMLVDRISALREANIYERHSYRHMLNQPVILEQKDNLVRSETAFIVLRIMRDGTTDNFVSGRYIDCYRIEGDTAMLAERIVVCDSSRIHTLLALPL